MDQLSIVPFDFTPSECEKSQIAWRLEIPNRGLKFDLVEPFTAGDSNIVLSQCPLCGFCGLNDTLVRLAEDSVVWFTDFDDGFEYFDRFFPSHIAHLCFDAGEYARALGSGDIRQLPSISASEFSWLCDRLKLPPPDVALDLSPEHADDPLGRALLVLIGRALARQGVFGHGDVRSNLVRGGEPSRRFQFSTRTPAVWREWRVLLDLEGTPEAIVRVGRDQSGFALRLVDQPCFPIWLRGPTVDQAFEGSHIAAALNTGP